MALRPVHVFLQYSIDPIHNSLHISSYFLAGKQVPLQLIVEDDVYLGHILASYPSLLHLLNKGIYSALSDHVEHWIKVFKEKGHLLHNQLYVFL